jgi:hypothetical protein
MMIVRWSFAHEVQQFAEQLLERKGVEPHGRLIQQEYLRVSR